MRITINRHRERIGNYHHDKIVKHKKLSDKNAPGKIRDKVQEKSFTLDIQNIVSSHQVYRHIDSRFRLKQIIFFILLLNHVRGHTRLSHENSDTAPLSLDLKMYNHSAPVLNEYLRFKTEDKSNHHTDGVANSTMELPEKIYIFSKTGIIINDEKTYYAVDKKNGDDFIENAG